MATIKRSKNKPKDFVIDAIVKTLRGVEKVSRDDLKKSVCKKINEIGEEFSESTYFRGLRELVENKLVIKSEDQLYYSLPKKHLIPGAEELTSRGGKIYTTNSIASAGLGIFIGRPQCYFDPEAYYISFMINETFLYLKISKKNTNFKVHIARKSTTDFQTQGLAQEKFGENLISLRLPYAKISSCQVSGPDAKSLQKLGHALITFENGSIQLEDLGSANRTYAIPIDNAEVEKRLNERAAYGLSTIHSEWGEDLQTKLLSTSHINSPVKISIPSIIFLSKYYQLIMI